ncbi:MAG TPA: BON domain-containing protein [Rhodocyclaceae bacterium]|nr:BON domain-containing protein [Rhodocyclaceae bacterium]
MRAAMCAANTNQSEIRSASMKSLKLCLPVAGFVACLMVFPGCSPQESANANLETPAAASTIGTRVDDAVILARLKAALVADKEIDGLDIKVEIHNGNVMLSGFVDDQGQADKALALARGTEGVRQVESGMNIKVGKESVGEVVDDSILTSRVKGILLADPDIRGADISVVTRHGRVQLSGFVNDQAQIDRAVEATRVVSGVHDVANQLSIKK